MKNYIKVGFVALVFIISIAVFGKWLAGRQGLLFGLILSFGIVYIIATVGNQLAFSFFQSRHLEGRDPWSLLPVVDKLAFKAKILIPKLYMIDSDFPTAFAAGIKKDAAVIFLTKGLVKKLTPVEVEAVIAQQIARIQRRDLLPAMVAAVLATTFLSLTDNTSYQKPSLSHQVLFSLFAPLALFAIYLNVGGRHYVAADIAACQWIENPMNLARALVKLDSYAKTQPPEIPYSLSHLFVVSPLAPKGWGRYFSMHPPLAKRVRKLVGIYPI